MKVVAVVPAAGRGIRLNNKIPKPLVLLGRYPILIHTLKTLSNNRFIDNIIVVANRNYLNKFKTAIEKYGLKKIKKIVYGGPTRSDSVRNGLKAIDKDSDLILIHDGVRPFINSTIIANAIKAAKRFGASCVAVPVKSTIKEIDSSNLWVKGTLERDILWEIQTPQVFRKDIILKAYKRYKNIQAFDDASLVEKMGQNVRIVLGTYKNIKITTAEDLLFAKAIIKKKA